MFKTARRDMPCRRSTRRWQNETNPRAKKAIERSARRHLLLKDDTPATPKSSRPSPSFATRGDQEALALLTGMSPKQPPRYCGGGRRGARQDPERRWRSGRYRAECLVRPVARLGAAARGDRACHHLRRDGRHQHGAWRDGHDRRLCHLRGAADHPHQLSRAVRLFAADSRCRWPSSSPARSAS